MGYDYSNEGLYFVTSCVQDKLCVFGHIDGGEMLLNGFGEIAERQWHWLEQQYPYVFLHAFVIMPNHVHALIEIDTGSVPVLPGNASALPVHDSDRSKPVHTKVKSISELMGVYKTTTSKRIRQAGLEGFAWQRSFHDHIIRHEQAFQRIEQYIHNNPALWKDDVFYQQPSP